jgi:hypothetical protein
MERQQSSYIWIIAIIAISGKAVYKYRYKISECTFLLLPFLLPTRQSSKIITCIYITPTKNSGVLSCG